MAARHQPSLLSKPPLLPLEPQLDSFCPSPFGGERRSGSTGTLYAGVRLQDKSTLFTRRAPHPCCQLHLRRGPGHQARLFISLQSPETGQTGLALWWCLCWAAALQVLPHCMHRAVEVTVGMLNGEKARLQLRENKTAAEVGSFCVSSQACTGGRALSWVSHPALNIPCEHPCCLFSALL